MSFTTDLLTGLAERLDAMGAGTWDPDAIIVQGATGVIVHGALPPEADSGIGLTPYNLQADPLLSDLVQPVQLWMRGDLGYVNDTADLIFEQWHGLTDQTVGGIPCPLLVLYSDAQMGVDDSGRRERALNYYVSANRQTASRPD